VTPNANPPETAATPTPPVAAAPTPTPTPAPTAEPAATPSEGKLKIVFHVDADSWMDVRDAQDNRLLYQLVLAGQTVSAEGEAPLAVFLGNAAGVRAELNGQPYDFSASIRGEIARFNVRKR
jgi:cytoskeleton protein RodZ